MDTAPLDLRRLQAFCLVARHGTMRDAATRLRLSMSAVSIQLSKLEDGLGTKLFQKSGRRLVLTLAGERFLEKAEAVIEAAEDAVQSVVPRATPVSTISLAIGSDLTRIFAPAIARFMKAHPEVEISLSLQHSPETIVRILEGKVEMGIGYFGDLPKALERSSILKSGFSMSFPKSHPLARIRSPSLHQIAEHHLIMLGHDTEMGQRIRGGFARAGLAPSRIIEAGNCQSSRELAAHDMGVAFSHTICLKGDRSLSLKSVDVSRYFGEADVSVVYRRGRRLSSAHWSLIDAIAAVSI